MKITIEDTLLEDIKKFINENTTLYNGRTAERLLKDIESSIEDTKTKRKHSKRHLSTQNATKIRTKKAKEKIQNSINLLRLEGRPITYNAIAVNSGVAYVTVRKYVSPEALDGMKV